MENLLPLRAFRASVFSAPTAKLFPHHGDTEDTKNLLVFSVLSVPLCFYFPPS